MSECNKALTNVLKVKTRSVAPVAPPATNGAASAKDSLECRDDIEEEEEEDEDDDGDVAAEIVVGKDEGESDD